MLTDSNRIEQKDKKIDKDVANLGFVNHLFVRLVAKNIKFTNIDFKYSIFDTCYLRDCIFDSCDFTGSRFVGTNLHGSKFSGCKFDYAFFEKTFIENDVLDTECPGSENLKMRFARTLRMNYQQLGDAISANKAVNIELEATQIHLYKAFRSNESYYRKKYSGWKRVGMFVDWLLFKTLDYAWGNGESVLKLLRSVVFVLIAIAILDTILLRNPLNLGEYFRALLDAPSIFLGVVSRDYPAIYSTLILFIRLITFGFLMSIIIKRFNRR